MHIQNHYCNAFLKDSKNIVIVTLSLDIAEHKTFPEEQTSNNLNSFTHQSHYNTTSIVIKVMLFTDIIIWTFLTRTNYYKNKYILDFFSNYLHIIMAKYM